jgi:hypothetical protein
MTTALKVFPFILAFTLFALAYSAERFGWKIRINRSYVYVLVFAGLTLSMVSVLLRPN